MMASIFFISSKTLGLASEETCRFLSNYQHWTWSVRQDPVRMSTEQKMFKPFAVMHGDIYGTSFHFNAALHPFLLARLFPRPRVNHTWIDQSTTIVVPIFIRLVN
jgi:hypothetical protein